MDLQSDVIDTNLKCDHLDSYKLLQFIGKEMNELDDKIRLLKKENDLLRKEIENLQTKEQT